MSAITLPEGYQYVGAALLSTTWVLLYQTRLVGKFRKASGIRYPQLYAEKNEVEASVEALKFNCAQRAHHNTLEQLPLVLITTLIMGVKAPLVAAAACASWSLNRISYTRGYTTGDPTKRITFLTKLTSIGSIALLLGSTYTVGECGMPKATTRPSLPTSSSDFALHPSSSPGASTSALTLDDPSFLLQRFRRPSLLSKSGYLTETRHHSPLASSFTMHSRRRSRSSVTADEFESDKERMSTDSPSSSSGNPTPPLKGPEATDDSEQDVKTAVPKLPSTPPRRRSSSSMDAMDNYFQPQVPNRRFGFPLKQPRILTLLAESRPEEIEVKSEAAFQRLISSFSDLPTQPRTPRSIADRGRYPEEAIDDDYQREETPSDGELEDTLFSFSTPNCSELITSKTHTPSGSISGDDLNMDIDMPLPSPSMSVSSTPIPQWRYTPPPTTSAVRSNKRKLDDRFDPYPTASKRRAVSPSLTHLRDNNHNYCTMSSPIGRNGGGNPRLPIAIPITIPGSAASSATSSPTISGSYPSSFPRAMSLTSSPTLRASVGLASPILRPVARGSVSVRRGDEEREVDGAGEAVNGLSLS
ncbi:hypothetical protein AMATHDRAFT_38086 [Amanita thiersii Skay4041]|uniref:Uncharacterized protein n=1 Tax=Amanita thiersii Skay4041 TaxID=703135 RepID=A0A2A9P1X3_9AGAR|nr:hypothetical protein AMATHDRAFT_38086 [Amanita thiersii Skay4041]